MHWSEEQTARRSRPLSGQRSPLTSGRNVSLNVQATVRVLAHVPASVHARTTPTPPVGAFVTLTEVFALSIRFSFTASSSMT